MNDTDIKTEVFRYMVNNNLTEKDKEELVNFCLDSMARKQALVDYFQTELDNDREHLLEMRRLYKEKPELIGSGTMEDLLIKNIDWFTNSIAEINNTMNDIINFKEEEKYEEN